MKRIYIIYTTCICFTIVLTNISVGSQPLEEIARDKIDTLKTLITEAEHAGIDALKEKMTVRTAEVFLKYANWDESHVAENTTLFGLVSIYTDSAAQMAEDLPDFERREVILLLDESIAFLTKLINGMATRKPIPVSDWFAAEITDDQVMQSGRPVFLEDYTWKPEVAELTEYYGNKDGYLITPSYVTDENGTINSNKITELENKPSGRFGSIFINNKGAPQWAKDKYGPGFDVGAGIRYTEYDIDNPGAREMMGYLLDGVVPIMAGKNYTKLGYMLCNEPHFYTTKKSNGDPDWASGPVSDYTKDKFKDWLKDKHGTIAALNALWNTNFGSFNAVTIDIPISVDLIGTAQWYDWMRFNNYRVTEWYTFLKNKILENDPGAKVHLKIMPNLWSENKRGSGIDLEALTKLSGIIGNDAGASHNPMWGGPYEWQEHYAFEWREMCMSFDFLKSVSPGKISYNSEAHYLSTVKSRDLYLDPAYARATYWLAHIHGLNVSQTWFWPRNEDGSPRSLTDKGYAGSNIQQPRVTNEVASTMMDLNSYGKEIVTMQRQIKPIRIFHSETSAINKAKHMDDVFELYESLFFEGIPIGFATEKIIKEQDNDNWEAILIYKTEFVTMAELNELQTYLDNGGTVIIDAVSLKKSEYGDSHPGLNQSNGTIVITSSATEMKNKAMEIVADAGLMPEVSVTETNSIGAKGCVWRCIVNDEGNNVLSVVNIGKSDATLQIELNGAMNTICKALITGIPVSSTPVLKPNEVYFVEVTDDNTGIITDYDNNIIEDNFVIPEESEKSNTTKIVKPDKSESFPEIEDENISGTEEKPFRSAYIINTINTSPPREGVSFVDSFNMSSKMIEENSETESIEAEPVQYAYMKPVPSEIGPTEQLTIKPSAYTEPVQEKQVVLSEADVLDESLLENSITNKIPQVSITMNKEVQKGPPAILPESKKRKKVPLVGIITATLLTSFGALVMIKDQ